MSDDLPGAHLAVPPPDNAEMTPGESIVKVVQRFVFKSFAWVGIYLLGYYDFSIAWLVTPLFLTVLRSQWKKERDAKLSAAREAALTNEKAMIESRISAEDLPSWVFFPDKERAEWVNSIIQQLWPNVGHYTRKLIAESIEPATKQALEGYGLKGFKFERVVLGQIPPRITGIKVYDKNVSRNEIIMDMDLVFASDCDIKFSVGKIKAKLMDLSLRGLLRVVFKPIINEIPLIGGIQVYFLSPPEIDFDLGGIANAFDAPGFSNVVRKIVLEQIGYFMVLPHKYTMPLVANVENKILKCPDTAGVLRVCLHKAVQLVKKDVGVLGMGKSDPYATLTVGAKTVKTPRKDNTLNPEWDFNADFPIEIVSGQQLTLELFDHDDTGDDEFLGRATVQTNVVAAKGRIAEMWVELEDISSGRALLSLEWLECSKEREDLDRPRPSSEAGLAKCVLQVYVDCVKDLNANRSSAQKPCPMVELKVGQSSQATFPKYYTNDPVFEQGFVFLVVNPHADDIMVNVVDTRKGENDVIGSAVVRMSDVLKQPNLELALQPVNLKGGGGVSTIHLSASVKPLKAAGKASKQLLKPPTDSKNDATKINKVPNEPKGGEESTEKKVVESEEEIEEEEFVPTKPNSPLAAMLADTVTPMVESVAETSVTDASASELRRRNPPTTQTTVSGCGKVKLSLKYDQDKSRLDFTVHQASGLPGGDLPDPPDPYVKVYLLPERKSKSKRKTEVIKDTVNPVFDESFDYDVAIKDLGEAALEVSVVDKKGIFARRALMGRAIVELDNPALVAGITEWFDLHEEEDDSD